VIEDALWSFLTTAPRLTAARVGQKVYPLLIPQEIEGDAVAYQTITTPLRELAHDGPGAWRKVRIQFTCQAKRPTQARAIAEAIATDLHGYLGTMGTHDIHYCSVDGDGDTSELFDVAVRRIDVEILYR
jgi:hypothetical protein